MGQFGVVLFSNSILCLIAPWSVFHSFRLNLMMNLQSIVRILNTLYSYRSLELNMLSVIKEICSVIIIIPETTLCILMLNKTDTDFANFHFAHLYFSISLGVGQIY